MYARTVRTIVIALKGLFMRSGPDEPTSLCSVWLVKPLACPLGFCLHTSERTINSRDRKAPYLEHGESTWKGQLMLHCGDLVPEPELGLSSTGSSKPLKVLEYTGILQVVSRRFIRQPALEVRRGTQWKFVEGLHLRKRRRCQP